jgi:hypothetical protein
VVRPLYEETDVKLILLTRQGLASFSRAAGAIYRIQCVRVGQWPRLRLSPRTVANTRLASPARAPLVC